MLGWIYFKYQRSIFTYCISESSRWKSMAVGVSHAGRGTGCLFCVGLFEHVPFLNYASTGKTQ